MRSDMFKVIVERPRARLGYFRDLASYYRQAKKFRLDENGEVDDEYCVRKLPIKHRRLGYDGKQLNENLMPLWRFIDKQVGRPWNDVYSEICENLNVNSTVQQHVRDHVDQHVEVNVYLGDDGKYYSCSSTGYGSSVNIINNGDLYVEPYTGILRNTVNYEYESPYKIFIRRRSEEKEVKTVTKRVDRWLSFERVNYVWYRYDYAKIPKYEPRVIDRRDALQQADGDKILGDELFKKEQAARRKHAAWVAEAKKNYGAEVYRYSVKTASKRDLKKYQLREVTA